MVHTLGLQFHPKIDPEVLVELLAMQSRCAEMVSGGAEEDALREETKGLQPLTDQNPCDLVNKVLDRIAIAEVVPVNSANS